MKLKMMFLALCVFGGTSFLLGEAAPAEETANTEPKSEEVAKTANDNGTQTDNDATPATKECGCPH